VLQGLDFSRSQTDANLDTPDLTNFRDTLSLDTSTGVKDDLLLALDLVALEQPAGGVLDDIAVVRLSNLLDQAGDLGLSWGLLGSGLLLFFLGSASQQARRNNESQKQLIGIVCRKQEVSFAAGDDILRSFWSGNNNAVTDNGSESVNLGTQLNLNDLSSLQGRVCLFRVRDQRSVWGHVRARRDRCGVSKTFSQKKSLSIQMIPSYSLQMHSLPRTLGDLLALVDLGNFLLQELVTLLTELYNLRSFSAPSCEKPSIGAS
jgi:hypothetical protein